MSMVVPPPPPVSIHASVKDATPRPIFLTTVAVCFNPRICKRCDNIAAQDSFYQNRFNPRICKRCDPDNVVRFRGVNVSIHASVKDATRDLKDDVREIKVSIHASVKDATFLSLT